MKRVGLWLRTLALLIDGCLLFVAYIAWDIGQTAVFRTRELDIPLAQRNVAAPASSGSGHIVTNLREGNG